MSGNTQEASTFGIDQQVYGDDVSGAGNAVQEDFFEPMPGNTQEASTFSINKQAYGNNALGNYVQGNFSEPMPQETSTFGINEQGYGYDALGNLVRERILEQMPQEASSAMGSDTQVYGNDASGADNAVQENFSKPTSGNTQEMRAIIGSPEYIPGEYLVKFKLGTSQMNCGQAMLSSKSEVRCATPGTTRA